MKIEDFFDSQRMHDKAAELLGQVEKEEKMQWLDHPCTKALMLTLKGDYIDYHAGWEDEVFVAPEAEGTAQKNAGAIGAISALGNIAKYIEGITEDD